MSLIKEVLDRVTVGKPERYRNLSIYPLLGRNVPGAGYLTLAEALQSGKSRVTEVSEHGSVPELFFENLCDEKVLLLDGEQLRGAKQNRMLNLTILIGSQIKVKIPVSCVEQGRWHYRSREFAAADSVMYSSARAEKMAAVNSSLRSSGMRRSNQGEVWDNIAAKASRMNARSTTGAADAIYETHESTAAEYRRAFKPQRGQVGALFGINGRMAGIELFDSDATFARMFEKVVTSYVIDAIDVDTEQQVAPSDEAVNEFLGQLGVAGTESFKALGEGHDLRIESPDVVGAALEFESRIVHLSAFKKAAATEAR
jgi:hypothetical protein